MRIFTVLNWKVSWNQNVSLSKYKTNTTQFKRHIIYYNRQGKEVKKELMINSFSKNFYLQVLFVWLKSNNNIVGNKSKSVVHKWTASIWKMKSTFLVFIVANSLNEMKEMKLFFMLITPQHRSSNENHNAKVFYFSLHALKCYHNQKVYFTETVSLPFLCLRSSRHEDNTIFSLVWY